MVIVLVVAGVGGASATVYTRTYANGTINIDDLGYTGPNGWTADDFPSTFGTLAYQQDIYTRGPDLKTPDAPNNITKDNFSPPVWVGANMDGQVNFGPFGYTSPAGMHFFMSIDQNGVYDVKKNDMQFSFYDFFDLYRNGVDTTPGSPYRHYDTTYNFYPYAISDGTGWCGSAIYDNPNEFAPMGGQIKFDFAFDVYLNDRPYDGHPDSTIIVTDFEMRSFGKTTVDTRYYDPETETWSGFVYESQAVMNNTNPVTGQLDPNYFNLVSFNGGGIIQPIVYLDLDGDGIRETPYSNVGSGFANMPFLLRADAQRIVLPTAVPEPSSLLLIGSGLAALIGTSKRKWISRK